jgi:putative acetyltransferase
MPFLQAHSGDQIAAARRLFVEYAQSLGIDFAFQDFERELAELPGAYAPPDGRLLLTVEGDEIVGCVALRRLTKSTCEMKRLYVQPAHRGKGVGRNLVEAVIAAAREIGYKRMRLDGVASLKDAAELYHSLGFIEIPPYRINPLPDAVYMELGL